MNARTASRKIGLRSLIKMSGSLNTKEVLLQRVVWRAWCCRRRTSIVIQITEPEAKLNSDEVTKVAEDRTRRMLQQIKRGRAIQRLTKQDLIKDKKLDTAWNKSLCVQVRWRERKHDSCISESRFYLWIWKASREQPPPEMFFFFRGLAVKLCSKKLNKKRIMTLIIFD